MRCFIFLFFFSSYAGAVDSLALLSPFDSIVVVDEVKLLKDTQHLTYDKAYALWQQNAFKSLPSSAKSLGVSNVPYWIALTLKNSEHDKLFLEFKYDQLSYVDGYIFKENQLLSVAHNGNALRFEDRDIEHFYVRFALLKSDEPLVYLFKIVSDRPMIIAMNVGTKSELDYNNLITIVGITLFSGCLFLLLAFNFMLYFLFRSKEYFYYIMYLMCFWIFIMYVNNYLSFLTQEFLWLNDVIRVLSAQGFHTALLLFTLYCLEVRRFSIFLVNLTYSLSAFCFGAFLLLSLHGSFQIIALIAGLLIPGYCTYLALYAWWKKVQFAQFYCLGLVGFYIGILLFWFMQMGYIEMLEIGKNALWMGGLWEMVIFAMILLLKIKHIKTESNVMKFHIKESEKERLHQSKYISIGRSIGNVAHQWKQPLNALGAILTNMKGSLILEEKIQKKSLVHSLDMSFDILKHLSETIDTFYSFLLKPYEQKSQFSVVEELESIQKILDFSFKNSNITMCFHSAAPIHIVGNPNEFIQVILNILLNAQDQFNVLNHQEAWIDIAMTNSNNICIIAIQDNAGGIAIEPIERIFDFNVSTKDNSAGVGLFICKSIIENHFNGTIEVMNKDHGACFRIYIPLDASASE